jgi:hypothetical protein
VAAMIVVVEPCFYGLACFSQREEHVLVEALIAQFAVERFDEGILHRPAGFDVVPLQSPGGPAHPTADSRCSFAESDRASRDLTAARISNAIARTCRNPDGATG